jgi:hypothetical protein
MEDSGHKNGKTESIIIANGDGLAHGVFSNGFRYFASCSRHWPRQFNKCQKDFKKYAEFILG